MAGAVRGRRLETVWDAVPGDGHRPAVPSDDHYEGSTRQRPVTNYILLAQSRSARTYARFRASLALRTHAHTYTVTSHAVRWRKSKSLGRLKASHGDPLDWSSSHVSPEKPLRSEPAAKSADPLPSLSLPSSFSDEAERVVRPSTHVRDPHVPGGPPLRDASSGI